MTPKSSIVCRLLGGTGRRLYAAVAPAKPPALLCAASVLAVAPAIAHAFVALVT